MNNNTVFDILVVYTSLAARSASNVTRTDLVKPFGDLPEKRIFNEAYAYFLKACAKAGLKAAFTTSADLTESGDSFSSYWLYKKNDWVKVQEPCESSIIFDKFSPKTDAISRAREKLFSTPGIEPFNNPEIYNMFFDKLKTYEDLGEFAIPTVEISTTSKKGIEEALGKLKNLMLVHPNRKDFNGKLVLKDRFGLGGRRIFKVDGSHETSSIIKILKNHKNTSFLMQPFVQFEKGYSYKRLKGFIDIRVIHINNNIVQVYLRIAPKGDFRCNEHLGGVLKYIPTWDLPKEVKTKCKQIVKKMGVTTSLFALDFIISDSGKVYLMEGNCGPGLDWNLSLRKNELEAKKFIRLLVNHIAKRVRIKRNRKYKEEYVYPLEILKASSTPNS